MRAAIAAVTLAVVIWGTSFAAIMTFHPRTMEWQPIKLDDVRTMSTWQKAIRCSPLPCNKATPFIGEEQAIKGAAQALK